MTGTTEYHPDQNGSEDDQGHVYRRRYERYAGQRQGRARSYSAVIFHSWRRALGIRRKWTSKILPIILYASAFIPVIGFISVPALVGIDGLQFSPGELFTTISLILFVFAAAAAPEMVCDDRRENVLPLYYSRGLSPMDYLAAKFLALGGIMLSVTLLPALILFLGNTFLDDEPFTYLAANWDQLPRIFATALLLCLFYAAIGLAVSSTTVRKGIASAMVVGVFLAGTAIAEGLYYAIGDGWNVIFALLAPAEIPEGVVHLMFGEAPSAALVTQADIEPIWYLASVAGFVLVSSALLYRRYLREE